MRTVRIFYITEVLLMAVILVGCVYIHNRGSDLTDIVTCQPGAGIGIHADIKATKWIHLGAGASSVENFKFEDGKVYYQHDYEIGLPLSVMLWRAEMIEQNAPTVPDFHYNLRETFPEHPIKALDISAGATAVMPNARLTLSPGELLDFLFGFVGLDFANDDKGNEENRFYKDTGLKGQWLAGCSHIHLNDFDGAGAGDLTLEKLITSGPSQGLDFAIVSPHAFMFNSDHIKDANKCHKKYETLTANPTQSDGLILLEGSEVCIDGFANHFGAYFPDTEYLDRNANAWQWFYQRNKKDGGSPGLLIINHPFADFRIPGFGTYDAHWYFEGSDSRMQQIMTQSYDGIEVFHLPTHAAEHILGRSGKDTALEKAFALLDADALRRRERLRAFAGIDNHHTFNPLLMPLMHVFAVTRTREAIYDALFKGHITLLGTDAFTFRACGDKDKSWVMTGGDVHADREVNLRWRGRAELFVDGKSQGVISNEYRHVIEPGSFHVYRIVCNGSYSNHIYANLPQTSNLIATVISSTQISLSWTDHSDDRETGFKIKRSLITNTNYTEIATVAANVTSYLDTRLTRDTKYYYRVRPSGDVVDNIYSNELLIVTTTGAPLNLTATVITWTQITLSWTNTAYADNKTGFKIERSFDGSNFQSLTSVDANATLYHDETVTRGNTYYYRVKASYPDGDSTYSNMAVGVTRLWAVKTPVTSPSARSGHSMVWDGIRVIMFGGRDASGFKNDLWWYDPVQNIWTEKRPISSPSARSNHSMVWDGQRVIMFGGTNGYDKNDLWWYDPVQNTWTEIPMSIRTPSARYNHSMVWDDKGQRDIMFGGQYVNQDQARVYNRNDLWWYYPATNTWVAQTPTGGPPAVRYRIHNYSMVWDGQRVIMFGGDDSALWWYYPVTNTWKLQTPVGASPPARFNSSMVWDGTEVIMFGGRSMGFDGALWWYYPVTNTWTKKTPSCSPSARVYHSMVWDGTRVIMFGGQDALGLKNDLWWWEFGGTP